MAEMDMRIETSEDTRAKIAAKLGLDQPSALDMVDRSKFATDAEYIDAAVQMEAKISNPEYQAARRRVSAEYAQRQEAEERARQEQEYKKIRGSVQLDDLDRREIDAQARDMARRDLAAGRIFVSDLGAAIENYARQLTEQRKDAKAGNELFNTMLRRKR